MTSDSPLANAMTFNFLESGIFYRSMFACISKVSAAKVVLKDNKPKIIKDDSTIEETRMLVSNGIDSRIFCHSDYLSIITVTYILIINCLVIRFESRISTLRR